MNYRDLVKFNKLESIGCLHSVLLLPKGGLSPQFDTLAFLIHTYLCSLLCLWTRLEWKSHKIITEYAEEGGKFHFTWTSTVLIHKTFRPSSHLTYQVILLIDSRCFELNLRSKRHSDSEESKNIWLF